MSLVYKKVVVTIWDNMGKWWTEITFEEEGKTFIVSKDDHNNLSVSTWCGDNRENTCFATGEWKSYSTVEE